MSIVSRIFGVKPAAVVAAPVAAPVVAVDPVDPEKDEPEMAAGDPPVIDPAKDEKDDEPVVGSASEDEPLDVEGVEAAVTAMGVSLKAVGGSEFVLACVRRKVSAGGVVRAVVRELYARNVGLESQLKAAIASLEKHEQVRASLAAHGGKIGGADPVAPGVKPEGVISGGAASPSAAAAYMLEHGCDYMTAVRAVNSNQPKQ